jgi:hypothetical protein
MIIVTHDKMSVVASNLAKVRSATGSPWLTRCNRRLVPGRKLRKLRALADMVLMIVAENKLVRTMNTGLREQHSRDAEKILNLETQIASFEPLIKNTRDAEKIFDPERKLDSLFQANKTSHNLLEIAKMDFDEARKRTRNRRSSSTS